ncbi:MerR family transcriptional regulator [Enterococcus sp. HY326]|uniref:MerR family transcriptional regulator n=1 Tax=Enterococcus sp. HY326 TaxID=2971265 RepID=UPI002240010C|nr:MerR family transcriptional regulator [Enterococcus sp. HY326]
MQVQEKFTISELSQKFALPLSTLRYYEEVGLLCDVQRDGKHRIFDESHIGRLEAIQCFKQTGMTIKQIREFFYFEDQTQDYQQIVALLESHCDEIQQQLLALQENQLHIQQKLAFYQAKKKALVEEEVVPQWDEFS